MALDEKPREGHFKRGVLAAYLTWNLKKFTIAELLQCAVVDHIFPREPQAICQLALRGNLAEWLPELKEVRS